MPIYEFSCPQGHDFERFFRTMSVASSEVNCPQCGVPATRLLSGGGGLLFKGSGFYITDYGKDGKKAQTDAPAVNKAESSDPKESRESKESNDSKEAREPAKVPEPKDPKKSKESTVAPAPAPPAGKSNAAKSEPVMKPAKPSKE